MDNNRVNSAFYLGMGYMIISLKSPTALSFRYTTIFKCEKKVCVCGGGGGGGGGGGAGGGGGVGGLKCHTSRNNISSEKKTDTTKLV